MKRYLFECTTPGGVNEGEEFIINANSYDDAKEIAYNNFGKCKCYGELTEREAEASGLDEY